MAIRDEDGFEIKAGDLIHFGYGIPAIGVRASVIERDGKLIVLTPGHKPPECPLSTLRKHVGNFYLDWEHSAGRTPKPRPKKKRN